MGASSLRVIVLLGLVSQTWTQGFRFGSGTFGSSTFGSSITFGSSSSSFGSSSGNGDYIASWDHGANSLTWHEGKRWCQSRGRRLVSLDSSSKADRYFSILSSENRPYFWSGGFKTVSSPSLSGEIVRWGMEILRASSEDLSHGLPMVSVVLSQMEEAKKNALPSSTSVSIQMDPIFMMLVVITGNLSFVNNFYCIIL